MMTLFSESALKVELTQNLLLHISSSLVKIWLHTKNKLSSLSVSALKVCVGWWWLVSIKYVVTPTLYLVEVGL